MDRRIFTAVGVVAIIVTNAGLALLGFRLSLLDPGFYFSSGGITYLVIVAGGLLLIGAGWGLEVGPLSWEKMAALAYVLFCVPILMGLYFNLNGDFVQMSAAYLVTITAITVLLLLSIAVDLALGTGRILNVDG